MWRIVLLVALFTQNSESQSRQLKEGERCVDNYTNTVGKCVEAIKCVSAREDYERNGIRPTFCAYSFQSALICCRDGTNILQTAPQQSQNSRPLLNNRNKNKRIHELKCIEYSKPVTREVAFVPLLPDPEESSVTAPKCNYNGVELIVGGENAALGEFPHMAAIGWVTPENKYKFSCGGSLISPRFVMTAGHCIRDPSQENPEPVIVRLGDRNINPDFDDGAEPVDVPIRRIIKHPDYKPPKKYNDIALLELATDVEFSSSVRPACLWGSTRLPASKGVATGWGVYNTRTQETSDELQKVSLSIINHHLCEQLLASKKNRNWWGVADSQLCAGELSGGKDTCRGDSGAPLQITSTNNQCIFHIIGITSFGQHCASRGSPAVYTRVSKYVDWIESQVWPGEGQRA